MNPIAPVSASSFQGEAFWGLCDQVAVSGTRFVTTYLVGRYGGPHVLGLYYLAWSLFLMYVCCQESLITTPYTVFINRYDEDGRREYVTGTLLVTGAMALIAGLSVVLFGWITAGSWLSAGFQFVALLLACALPGLAVREFGRRVELAHARPRNALVIDAVAGVLQLLGLALLYRLAWFQAGPVWGIVGLASGLGGAVWLYLHRNHFRWTGRASWRDIFSTWRFGLWVFSGQVSGALLIAAAPWILAMYYDESQVGIYGACMTVILFSNPFVLGFGNVLGPRAARTFRESGLPGLRRLMLQANVVVLVIMGAFSIMIIGFGERMMELFGKEYVGTQDTLFYLALLSIAFALAACCSLCLAAVERPDLNTWGALAGMVVGLVATLGLTPTYGTRGAAAGVFVGHLVWAVINQSNFFLLTSPSRAAQWERPQ